MILILTVQLVLFKAITSVKFLMFVVIFRLLQRQNRHTIRKVVLLLMTCPSAQGVAHPLGLNCLPHPQLSLPHPCQQHHPSMETVPANSLPVQLIICAFPALKSVISEWTVVIVVMKIIVVSKAIFQVTVCYVTLKGNMQGLLSALAAVLAAFHVCHFQFS